MSLLQNTDFEYRVEKLSHLDVEAFAPFFERLPRDPYVSGNYRRRRFSRFRGQPERLTRLEHKYFEQSSTVNKLAGGIKRDFAELEDDLLNLPEFQRLVAVFIDATRIDPNAIEIGVHQIRIVAEPGQQGEPAPEGIHQDGFDFVGIFCIRRENVTGAETHLYTNPQQRPPLFAKELQPGEFVLVNDRTLYHYTSPIRPAVDGQGIRDVFVMTA
jgi:hypothetical protein